MASPDERFHAGDIVSFLPGPECILGPTDGTFKVVGVVPALSVDAERLACDTIDWHATPTYNANPAHPDLVLLQVGSEIRHFSGHLLTKVSKGVAA